MDFKIIPVTQFQQNCTLLICPETRATAIVDPGGEPERIIEELKNQDANPVMILLTHGHMDHVGATPQLSKQLDVPVLGPHADDAFWLQALPEQAEMFGFPAADAFEPNQWLEHGQSLDLGKQTLDVLHCPGHTPGHVVLHHRPSALAQVGDVLFRGSIGRTDFPRGDHAQLIRSIRTRLFPLGDEVRFIPGHGPMGTLGEERRTNPFVR